MRVSPWEWAQTVLLVANLAWTTLLRGGYPPQVMLVTSALTAALVAVHFVARAFCSRTEVDDQPEGRAALPAHPAGWFFVPFLVYATINAAWISPVPWLAWRDWFFWAQLIAVFWVVLNGIPSSLPQRVLIFAIALLGLVGVALACYQVFANPDWQMLGGARTWYRGRASGSFGMPNSFAAFLLLGLPLTVALALRRSASATQRVWWGWVAAVLALGFVLTISRGAWLALVGAMTLWPLVMLRGGWMRRVGVALLVGVGLALVGVVLAIKSPAVRARFVQLSLDAGERTRPIMWRAAWNLFRDRPLAGTGAGSYDVLFERYRPERFTDEPLYAHNDYLNTLSDYGLAGAGLFFGACLAVAILVIRRRGGAEVAVRWDMLDSPAVRAAFGIGLLAFALHLVVEFHLKIPALGLVVATIAGVGVGRAWPVARRAETRSRLRGAAPAAMAVVCAAGYVFFFLPQFRAEALRKPARATIDALAHVPEDAAHYRGPLERARAALTRATALDPANAQAWADLAYVLELWPHVEPGRMAELGKSAEAMAGRALAGSRVCHEFWIRRGVARDMQDRWVEASDDFAQAVKLAPTNTWAWYYYAEHLSRVYAAREAADAAAAFCLRLDPGNPLGLALRQRLAIKPTTP